jgi:predicted enzyme related to lactoylglutathione lyase
MYEFMKESDNMSDFHNGHPARVELRSPAPKASAAFYEGLFDWDVRDKETGLSAARSGRSTASIAPVTESGSPGWVTFFSVNDAEETSRAIIEAGGSILEPVTDEGTVGRRGLFADNVGARFALWQPGKGAETPVMGEPGAFSWSELISDDVAASIAFYAAIFGWTATDPEGPLARQEFHAAGRAVAGLLPKGPHMPAEMKPYWDVYFQTADADAAAVTVTDLGGLIALPPMHIDLGRLAVFIDPAGAIFSVVGPRQEEQQGEAA